MIIRILSLASLLFFLHIPITLKCQDSTLVVAENQEAELAFNEGNQMLSQGKFNEAILSYNRAISFKPDFAKAYINRAVSYTELKMFQKAYNDYDFVVGLNNSSAALYGKGMVNYYLNNLDESENDLMKAKDNGFNDPGVFYFLAAVAFENKNYDKAIELYTLCLNLKPDYINALNDRGSAKRLKGDFEGAIIDYQSAIKLNPNIDFLYNNLASAYWKKGKLDDAIVNYGLAIHINVSYVAAYNNRASVKIEKGDYQGAIKDCNKAIEIDPNYTFAYNSRANAYMKQEKFDLAQQDYSKAITLDNNFSSAYLNRGICFEMQRNFKKAIADWKKAYELGINKALNYINFYE